MAKEVVWLLDVDGVINANKAGWSAAPRSGYAYCDGREWKMRWAPQLISRIRAVNNLPHVSILWATSWVGHTDQLERLFKLPPLLSAGSRCMEGSDKYKAAEAVVNSGKKLIWTDDEFTPQFGPWYDTLTRYHSSLLIAPHPNRGLRPEHLDQIDQFVLG